MATIYPAQANSPQTLLSAQLSADAVTVPVQSAAVLPEAPNLAVIGTGEDCETILYTGKSGNNLTGVTRGFEGTAKAWPAQTVIARNFTAWDFNNMAAVKADKEETETALATKVDTVDALPVYTMARSSDPTDCWQPTPGIAVPDTGPYTGMAIRAVWEEEWDASVPIWCFGSIYGMQASGHHPAGTYILTFTSSYDWTIQSLDMAYTDERAEQAADEAAEAHAAQVRRTYQPAWKRTATGCPVSVADAAEGADLSGLVLKGRTMVSGTPSPDAPVTITGVKPQTVAVTGKNLIPPRAASETINGVTCTVNADGSLTLNGTATGNCFFHCPDMEIVSGIYTLSSGVKLPAGITLILRKKDINKQIMYVYAGSSSKTKLTGYSGKAFVYVAVSSGTTVTNLTLYPQLEVGSEATAYEPYQGETITSDEVELYGDAHTVGKNLIPTMDEPLSANGITCTVNVDGSIALNGTATANAYFYFPDIMIMSSGTYTLSTSANLAGGTSFVLRTRSNNVWLINIQAGSKSKSEAISYSGAAQAYITVASGTTLSDLTIYPQLEAGSEATAYEPYQGMTTALEDGDSLDLATGEVVRRWKRLELDGTEKWTIQSVNEYGITNFNTVLSDGGDFAKGCICTHYVTQYTVIANTHDRGIFISNTHSLFIRETAYTTVEEFKTWLAAQKEAGTPVTVLYKLEEPEVVSGGAHSLAQPEGEMAISALGTRGETAEAVDTEALYTYRPNWDDVLSRLAELEVQQAETQARYGVKFGGSANTGATVARLYNAVGLVAGVGTDTATAINDFDGLYPWSARRRCCGYWDDNGNFVVNAYKGEPGYIEDGTNGEVWVEHSLFFYKHEYSDDGAEEIVISATQLAGFLPAPIFLKPDGTVFQKAYTAAFPLAIVEGKATSRAGVFSDTCSLNAAMEKARTLGTDYTVGTTAEWYTECLYMWVEFATRNMQSVMNGASSLSYVASDTATVAETAVNRIIVASTVAAKYVVGQTILIGTSLGSSNIANNRIVTAIEDYDAENKAIVFDGEPVNIAVGNIVCTAAWINGSCNDVLSSSGSPVSNTSGKYNCVYRGKETPYGNAYEWISDILFSRQGAGTTESPYTYDVHFLPNPTEYSGGTITEDYIKLNFNIPNAAGYAKKLGYDSRFPWLRIPCEVGAGSTTYYSDYYYSPQYAVCAARVGGSWGSGPNSGPCYWYCDNAPFHSYALCRARLSYHRT